MDAAMAQVLSFECVVAMLAVGLIVGGVIWGLIGVRSAPVKRDTRDHGRGGSEEGTSGDDSVRRGSGGDEPPR